MFKQFHELFPEVAAREVRYFRIEGDAPPGGIPTGEYGFIEALPGQTGSSPIRSWAAEPRWRGESARQKRKQQKAARRANRRS
jgi:hypothetical protein